MENSNRSSTVIEHDNSSVDTVRQDIPPGRAEGAESTRDVKRASPVSGGVTPDVAVCPISTSQEQDVVVSMGQNSLSVSSIDLEPSKKYTITLDEAKRRALKAARRSRERASSVRDDEDEL